MKKSIIVLLFLLVSIFNITKCFAQNAWNQAQGAGYCGNNAVHSSSDEGARYNSGCVFDTPCNSPSVVDLRGAGEHPTPILLRTSDDNDNPYIPKQYKSLHTTPPPPLQ